MGSTPADLCCNRGPGGPNSASKRALTFDCFPSRFTMGPFGGALPELADVIRWEGQVIYGIGVWGTVGSVLCGESRVLGW